MDSKHKNVEEADEYSFSEHLTKTLKAIFLENEALRITWLDEMFPVNVEAGGKVLDTEDTDKEKNNSVQYFSIVKMKMDKPSHMEKKNSILIEAVEFCVLEYLSLHLSEYFDNNEHNTNKIVELERSDIPHMLLNNRILSLLTTPIEDRPIFVKSGLNKKPPQNGEIHAIYSTSGAVYEKFHLSLPLGTEISRPQQGVLILKHPRFKIEISISYDGFTNNLPKFFSELYVSDSSDEIDARMIDITLSAEISPLALLTVSSWEYYEWIDSLMAYLNKCISFDEFLRDINWTANATKIHSEILKSRRKQRQMNEVES